MGIKTYDGSIIRALKINVSSKGEPTTVSLRPERITICSDKVTSHAASGIVKEIIYNGDHLRIRLQVADNKNFILKVPNSAEEKYYKVGDALKLDWRIEDARSLDYFPINQDM